MLMFSQPPGTFHSPYAKPGRPTTALLWAKHGVTGKLRGSSGWDVANPLSDQVQGEEAPPGEKRYQAISVAIRPCRFVLRRARRAHSCSRREMIGNCFSTVRGKSSSPGSASGRPTIHPVATVNATASGRTCSVVALSTSEWRVICPELPTSRLQAPVASECPRDGRYAPG
jgi:hypothetical protein